VVQIWSRNVGISEGTKPSNSTEWRLTDLLGPVTRVKKKRRASTEMCSGSEAGSYLRFIDFVYLSTLGLRVIKKKRRAFPTHAERRTAQVTVTLRPYPEYSRANSYPWSPPPPRRARPGPGPHSHALLSIPRIEFRNLTQPERYLEACKP